MNLAQDGRRVPVFSQPIRPAEEKSPTVIHISAAEAALFSEAAQIAEIFERGVSRYTAELDASQEEGKLISPILYENQFLSEHQLKLLDAAKDLKDYHLNGIDPSSVSFEAAPLLSAPQALNSLALPAVPCPTFPVTQASRFQGPSPLFVCPSVQETSYRQAPIRKEGGHTVLTVYEMAELVKQRVLLRRYGGEIYLFDGSIYRKITGKDLAAKILTVIRDEIERVGTSNVLTGVATFLTADETLDDIPIDNPLLLCLQNGILDMRDKTIVPHNSNYFFTTILDLILYDLNPEPTPAFDQFMEVVTGGDPTLCQRMLEALGYLLTSDMNGKVFVFAQGVGNSGKSVFGNLVSSFYQPEAVSYLDIFRFGERFSSQTLVDKRLNICMDLPSTRLKDDAVGALKMLTGNDGIAAEKKFGDTTTYRCTCKFLFGSNHPITLGHADPAFEDRVLLLPFSYSISKEQQDKNLLNRLLAEKSGILKHALAAYEVLVSHNYVFTGGHLSAIQMLQAPVVPLETVMEKFICSCCMVASPEDVFTSTSQLYSEFCRFYGSMIGSPYTGDSVAFSRLFHAKTISWARNGKRRTQDGNLNGYFGVSLVPQC